MDPSKPLGNSNQCQTPDRRIASELRKRTPDRACNKDGKALPPLRNGSGRKKFPPIVPGVTPGSASSASSARSSLNDVSTHEGLGQLLHAQGSPSGSSISSNSSPRFSTHGARTPEGSGQLRVTPVSSSG